MKAQLLGSLGARLASVRVGSLSALVVDSSLAPAGKPPGRKACWRVSLNAVGRWLALAGAGLLTVQGCAVLATGRPQSRIELGEPVATEQLSRLQEPPVPQVEVRVDHLRAEVQVLAVRRCVAQQLRSQPRTQVQWTGYPRWAWSLAAVEAGAAIGAWHLGKEAQDGATAWAWRGAAVALVAAAAVDVWRIAGQGQPLQRAALPALAEFGRWRLVTCGSEPAASHQIALRGGRADWHTAVDLSGSATIAVDQLPVRSFPYQSPLAEVTCAGCPSTPLILDAAAAADLVIARQDLQDLETWLALHPGHPAAAQVAAARLLVVQTQKAERQQAQRAAERALEEGDLASAAQAVRRCQDAASTPAPACDELGKRVDDRFVAVQLDQGRRALARGAAAEAEAALYRCTLVERRRPACQELQALIAQAREQALAAQRELALQRAGARDAGLWLGVRHQCRRGPRSACRAAVERCLAGSPEHALCLQKQAWLQRRRQGR